jgi:hypothetical protein
MVRGLVLDRRLGSAYVKLVRSIPLPLLIAIVLVKGFVFGWLVGGAERVVSGARVVRLAAAANVGAAEDLRARR